MFYPDGMAVGKQPNITGELISSDRVITTCTYQASYSGFV